jgi:hypothetical protein
MGDLSARLAVHGVQSDFRFRAMTRDFQMAFLGQNMML